MLFNFNLMPFNLISLYTRQEEQRRKKGSFVPRPKIELGAVLNTTCRKCGTVGGLPVDDLID